MQLNKIGELHLVLQIGVFDTHGVFCVSIWLLLSWKHFAVLKKCTCLISDFKICLGIFYVFIEIYLKCIWALM